MKAKRAREQDETRLAALVYLSRALDWGISISSAEDWVASADLPWFVEEIHKRAAAFAAFIEDCLENHAGESKGRAGEEAAWLVERDLDHVRKNLNFLSRIGKAVAKKDAGKSNPQIAREVIRRVIAGSALDFSPDAEKVAGCGSAPDFAIEREELRRLRAGELKPPPDLNGRQQP